MLFIRIYKVSSSVLWWAGGGKKFEWITGLLGWSESLSAFQPPPSPLDGVSQVIPAATADHPCTSPLPSKRKQNIPLPCSPSPTHWIQRASLPKWAALHPPIPMKAAGSTAWEGWVLLNWRGGDRSGEKYRNKDKMQVSVRSSTIIKEVWYRPGITTS